VYYELAEVLINKSLLTKDMEIEIEYYVTALGSIDTMKTTGSFVIQQILRDQAGKIFLIAASITDGEKRTVSMSQICSLDGMDPSRFAAVYGIAFDGSKLSLGKRRGRVPKAKISEVIEKRAILDEDRGLMLNS
jgi:hypothetical protein